MEASRALALGAMVGAALLVVGNLILLADPDARGRASGADYPTVAIVTLGALLLCAGLVGIHLRQRAAYGKLGLAGTVLALIAQLATALFLVTVTEAPLLIALAAGVVGFLLLTVAIHRAPVVPRWSGYLAYIGFVGLLIVSDADLGIAAAGVVWLVIGYALWVGSEPDIVPARP